MVELSIVMLVFWVVRDDSADFSLFLHIKKLHFSWGRPFLTKKGNKRAKNCTEMSHGSFFSYYIYISFWKASIDDSIYFFS